MTRPVLPPPSWPLFAAACCLVPPLGVIAVALYATDRLCRRKP